MADPANDLLHSGPTGILVSLGLTVAMAIAGTLNYNSRIAALEEKLDKLSKAQDELEERLDRQLRDLERESLSPDGIRALTIEAVRPCMDKLIDLRERLADLAGTVKSLGGR
jgi:chromosome segregation ATPase